MNSFLKEIARATGLPFDAVFSSYRYVNFGGGAVYVQGHNGVIAFDSERVALRVGRKRLEIRGGNLFIKQLSGDDVVINGDIAGVAEAAN